MIYEFDSLNQGQQEAARGFLQFLLTDQKEFILSGAGGYGKTHLLGYLANKTIPEYMELCDMLGIASKYKTIHMTATTNKAAEELSNSIGFPAVTIHSLMNLVVRDNLQKGITEVTLKKGSEFSLIYDSIIVIDECSYIDKQLYDFILKRTPNCKILYVGDSYQLPPVFEEKSAIYQNKETPFFKLTEPMRNAGKPALISLCEQFRRTIDTGTFSDISLVPGVVDWLDAEKAQEDIEKTFSKQDPGNKIIAYSNSKVVNLNHFTREVRGISGPYKEGEILVCNSAHATGTNNYVISTEEILVVTEFVSDDCIQIEQDVSIEFYWVVVESLRDKYYRFSVKVPKDTEYLHKLLKYYASKKEWATYFSLKNSFIDLRPLDACTVHKSQGSSYKTVYIDLSDLSKCTNPRLAAKLFYVAVSRARDRIVFFGDLSPRFGKLLK